jgi:RNA recognition motif-containing protein
MKDTERNPNDFETTIFIGNLPFIVNEEDLRAHILKEFKDHDPILNVRLIRDP